MQARTERQAQEIDTSRGDVFAELSRLYVEARVAQIIKKLRLDKMNLPVVRDRRVLSGQISVLDGGSAMGIALDPVPGDETHSKRSLLAETVRLTNAHLHDHRLVTHQILHEWQ